MSATRKKPSRLRLPRAEWLVGFTLLLVAGFLAALTILVVRQSADLQAANKARDALAAQVQRLGGKPVAGPPGSRGDPGQTVRGPKGDKGDTGEPGSPGSPGPSGSPGKTGKNGDDGSKGTDGVGSTGPTGAAGSNGVPGPAGPAGPQGDPGPAGPEGPAGQDGSDGTNGQTCPDGYSLQAPAYDPDALVCRRDGAPQPEKKGSGLLSSGALDPTRRQY
ncbi:collagen-like protein [Streptomyces sp. NPDC005349]|uniref:collagen-like protein n=1 Tax=Streptomyces sp. NPDC005349 TaxID=3157037 RepID=UPI0033BABF72